MSEFENKVAQLQGVLKHRYFPIILALPQNWTAEQHERNRLSRALAAFAIEKLADVAPAQAANAVIDGGNDNGIDAVHFDRPRNLLLLIQSKAGSGPDMGENKKFCDGIRDLVEGRFDKFNQSFSRFQSDVEEALGTAGLRILAAHVYCGETLGPHVLKDLDQLKKELNQFVERFNWKDLSISVTHGWLAAEHAPQRLDVSLSLEKWYGVDKPRRAFYGLVKAVQLAVLYQQHGKLLFEKNIRHYLGAQTVNLAIEATVRNHPSELFYLNNGLTAVCSAIGIAPGATNLKGTFFLKGFSIVNGAQTVGSIATAQGTGGAISPEANLLITLIEVGVALDNLGPQVTRARNTQNAVRGLHFAALDPNQERLRQELAISGITYHYRPSAEALKEGPTTIGFEKAALALSCFSGSTKAVVAGKSEIGQIYDRNAGFYNSIFKDNLTGVHLCRAVRIFDYLNGILGASERAENDYNRRMFFRHGRYFVFHILARRHRSLLDKPEMTLSEGDKTELSRVLLELAELIYQLAESRFKRVKGYLAIFRNTTDAIPLAQDVMERLKQVDMQKEVAEHSETPTKNTI
jgi:hypothetical protein